MFWRENKDELSIQHFEDEVMWCLLNLSQYVYPLNFSEIYVYVCMSINDEVKVSRSVMCVCVCVCVCGWGGGGVGGGQCRIDRWA